MTLRDHACDHEALTCGFGRAVGCEIPPPLPGFGYPCFRSSAQRALRSAMIALNCSRVRPASANRSSLISLVGSCGLTARRRACWRASSVNATATPTLVAAAYPWRPPPNDLLVATTTAPAPTSKMATPDPTSARPATGANRRHSGGRRYLSRRRNADNLSASDCGPSPTRSASSSSSRITCRSRRRMPPSRSHFVPSAIRPAARTCSTRSDATCDHVFSLGNP